MSDNDLHSVNSFSQRESNDATIPIDDVWHGKAQHSDDHNDQVASEMATD